MSVDSQYIDVYMYVVRIEVLKVERKWLTWVSIAVLIYKKYVELSST